MATNSKTQEDTLIVRVIVIVLVVTGVPGLAWNWLRHDSHWIHHEKLMTVYAESWASGEYKQCATLNVELEEPPLTCDGNAKAKTFKVRFDGDTYIKGKPQSMAFRWTCRKYGEGDAAIDCESKPVEGAAVEGRRVSIDAAQEIWTSEDEPPGRVVPQDASCPEQYKPIKHVNGVGGSFRHVDCVPLN